MTVTVLLFASFADALGRSSINVVVAPGATVGDVVNQVNAAGSGRLPPHPLVALNAEYANYASPVHAGDELALIPPVAGG